MFGNNLNMIFNFSYLVQYKIDLIFIKRMSKDKFFNDYRFVFPKRKSKDNLLINFLYGTTKYGKTQKKIKK